MRQLVLALLALAYAATFVRLPSFGSGTTFDPLEPRGREVERALADGRFQQAQPIVEELRERHPDDLTLLVWAATIAHGLGRPADEVAAWEAFLRGAKRSDEACPALPEAYARLGDGAGQLEALERCAALAPDDPERWGDLAAALAREGRQGEAAAALERVRALDPAHPALAGHTSTADTPAPGMP